MARPGRAVARPGRAVARPGWRWRGPGWRWRGPAMSRGRLASCRSRQFVLTSPAVPSRACPTCLTRHGPPQTRVLTRFAGRRARATGNHVRVHDLRKTDGSPPPQAPPRRTFAGARGAVRGRARCLAVRPPRDFRSGRAARRDSRRRRSRPRHCGVELGRRRDDGGRRDARGDRLARRGRTTAAGAARDRRDRDGDVDVRRVLDRIDPVAPLRRCSARGRWRAGCSSRSATGVESSERRR